MTDISGRAAIWMGQQLNRRGFVGRLGRAATLATFSAAGMTLLAPRIASADLPCCSSCLASCCDSISCYCCAYNTGLCPNSSCSGTCNPTC